MTKDQWLTHIRASIFSETGFSAEDITFETVADDVPGWDSLAHVRIMMRIEMLAGIPVDIDETYRASSVGELADQFAKNTP